MKQLFYGILFTLALTLILLSQVHTSTQLSKRNSDFRIPVGFDQFQLDPLYFSQGQSQLIIFNLFEGLTRLKNEELEFAGANYCKWVSDLKLTCELKKKRWSDQKPLTSKDYLFAFKRILKQKGQGAGLRLLSSLQNLEDGFPVVADDETHLTFFFKKHDSDFLMKLASPYLIPWRDDQLECPAKCFTNGPFRIINYKPGYSLQIQRSATFSQAKKINVSFLLVESDASQLRLYENNQIDLVRRIATSRIEDFRDRNDFHLHELLRFDYIGFGPDLQTSSFDRLRELLVSTPQYDNLQEIYQSPDSLDCLPHFIGSTCLSQFKSKNQPSISEPPKLELSFSRLGGDDVIKGMEWFQSQWMRAGVLVTLQPLEQKFFFKTLRTQTPRIFRKGFNLERPTCRALLESFSVAGSESFAISPDWQKRFEKELNAESFSSLKSCEGILLNFLKEWRMIPLGTLTQPFLVKPQFRHWLFNPMGQLFLEDLTIDEL